MEEVTKVAFRKEIDQLDKKIAEIKSLDVVNKRLKTYNWIFLHPYSHGIDIKIIQNILASSTNPEQQILLLFARKFLSLRNTIHFVVGHFKKRPFLEDYANDIEESVILCLQKDFHGAINILLPVIEGTLRKCLIHQKGTHKKSEVSMEELLKVMDIWIDQYVNLNRQYLKEQYKDLIALDMYFDINQEKGILNKRKEYFTLWIGQLKNYLENNLYLNTKDNIVTDTFNRHIIFHALEDNIEFSFGNYLRLFNCIHYLSWAIGSISPECSVLSEASEEEVMKKWVSYMKILSASEAITNIKTTIFGKNIESFRPYIHKSPLHIIERPIAGVIDALAILNVDLKETKQNKKEHYKIPKNPFKTIIYFLLLKLASKFSPSNR